MLYLIFIFFAVRKVYKAVYTDPKTGEKSKFALKKLNMMEETEGFPLTALREIKYLK